MVKVNNIIFSVIYASIYTNSKSTKSSGSKNSKKPKRKIRSMNGKPKFRDWKYLFWSDTTKSLYLCCLEFIITFNLHLKEISGIFCEENYLVWINVF